MLAAFFRHFFISFRHFLDIMQLKLFEIQPIEKEFNCYDCFYSKCENIVDIWNNCQINRKWICTNYNISLKSSQDNLLISGDVIIHNPKKSKNCKYFKHG